jgi:type IV pilus assembly protein PilW
MSIQRHYTRKPVARAAGIAAQTGLTLIELMIAIVLGLLVVLAATALLLSTKTTYTQQDESTRIEDAGRYALELVTRALHQTAFENWDTDGTSVLAGAEFSTNIRGFDANDVGKTTPNIETLLAISVNGSDVLALRFFGTGGAPDGDGTVLNCAGFSVAAPPNSTVAEASRGWSIFHVSVGDSGESELRCKYQGKGGKWTSTAIVPGVESFQVLYGIDTDGDGMPNSYMNASSVDQLDAALVLVGSNADERARNLNRRTYWKKVVMVKIGLLMRGGSLVNKSVATAPYDLLGEEYGENHPATDSGVHITEADFPEAMRNRLRKVFTQTIQLRNKTAGGV